MMFWYSSSVEKSKIIWKALFVVFVDLLPWLISRYQWFKNQLTEFLNIEQVTLESQYKSTATTTNSAKRLSGFGRLVNDWLPELEWKEMIPQKWWDWTKINEEKNQKVSDQMNSITDKNIANALRQESIWHIWDKKN